MDEKQEKILKALADAVQKKRIADQRQELATRRVLLLQKKCLNMGVKIKSIDHVYEIVEQWGT